MTQEQLHDVLFSHPSEDGAIDKYDHTTQIPYRIQRLPPGQLNEIRIQRNAYLAERGIEECTPATAEIFDKELELRVLAAAVLDRETGEALAPLETWRKSQGAAVRTCIAHYTKLDALADEIDLALVGHLPEITAYIRQQKGPGRAAFWGTFDYETLLACLTALSLAYDELEAKSRRCV